MIEAGEDLWEPDGLEDEDVFDTDDDFETEEERVAAIGQVLADWQAQTGAQLSTAEWQAMGTQIDLYGMTPDQAYESTDTGRFEANFENLVDRIEADQGRSLTEPELDRLWGENLLAEREGENEIDITESVLDLDDEDDRAEYIGTRLAVPREREEASAVTEDGSPSFNYENPAEREAAIDAAMSGETVSVHDSSDLLEGDE